MLERRDLTERIIGLAIEVHRQTGPELLQSVYTACLAFELEQAGISLMRQVSVPVFYKGRQMPLGSAPTSLWQASLSWKSRQSQCCYRATKRSC